ncbi:hypothetical protein HHK36_005988 [Tetracentron sinense]|uniref:Glycylpeptide N-tetradecanoyltransferase n=1 Tax=Tetracentron sinense TaxID=13715 RepID=A0A834ZR16_TETSI|nr:hypothetical protein HHK36_005988 [Tetracentron sinense]
MHVNRKFPIGQDLDSKWIMPDTEILRPTYPLRIDQSVSFGLPKVHPSSWQSQTSIESEKPRSNLFERALISNWSPNLMFSEVLRRFNLPSFFNETNTLFKLVSEMADCNSSSGSPDKNPKPNPNSNPPSESDSSIETISRKVQETLSIEKKHKFWETQPVGQFKDLGDSSLLEGPIEPPTPLSEVRQEPYNLPNPYEWTICDIDSEETCTEVYNLLTNNYVEDDENMFRFNYSKEFLRWALRPPGYFKNWHIGVCVKVSKKLVAFISGVPAKIRVRDEVVTMAEINFLCVHKKLRSKRLAPVMIKEVTRRVHLENIWQAAYTAGVVLPTPISTCQYWHRSLNPKKLIDVGFSRLGPRMTMSRTIKLYKLRESTVTPGFRKMVLCDVPAITRLLKNYLSQFVVAPDFDEDDVEHWLLPTENVVDSYLVESPETHEITDFCSFYTLPSSILGNQNYSTLKAAYSYYNVSTRTPLLQLMNDALLMAKQKDYDVFNALEIMQNESFLKELKFGPVKRELEPLKINTYVNYGGIGSREDQNLIIVKYDSKMNQLILSSGIHVIIGTPGPVFGIFCFDRPFAPDNIKMFVLVEADELLHVISLCCCLSLWLRQYKNCWKTKKNLSGTVSNKYGYSFDIPKSEIAESLDHIDGVLLAGDPCDKVAFLSCQNPGDRHVWSNLCFMTFAQQFTVATGPATKKVIPGVSPDLFKFSITLCCDHHVFDGVVQIREIWVRGNLPWLKVGTETTKAAQNSTKLSLYLF